MIIMPAAGISFRIIISFTLLLAGNMAKSEDKAVYRGTVDLFQIMKESIPNDDGSSFSLICYRGTFVKLPSKLDNDWPKRWTLCEELGDYLYLYLGDQIEEARKFTHDKPEVVVRALSLFRAKQKMDFDK
jgi:hypothetical protein